MCLQQVNAQLKSNAEAFRKNMLVWDLPIRLFHWCLVILVSVSFYTGLHGGFNEMDYHMLSGYGILTLLIFRFGWGFAARGYARFDQFIPAVWMLRNYLQSSQTPVPGHNPLGAVSVIAMLVALLTQALTGLFANDDILLEGPLVHLVSPATSGFLTSIHHTMAWLTGALAGLHIAAIMYYEIVKQQRLIKPMLVGKQAVHGSFQGEESQQRLWVALALILLSAGFVYILVYYL